MSDVKLPALVTNTSIMLNQLTEALSISREILASDEEIYYAWQNLPRELKRIPPELRGELLAKMCIAVASGLFDSAINYVWNATILELRNRVRAFGLHVVPQIIGRQFDEKALLDLKDSELLTLCVSLNLIAEDGYFFLDQCREVRNNFSVAHPSKGTVDDREFILFLSRCAKYALADTKNPRGVDTHAFLDALKKGKFSEHQIGVWVSRIEETHEAQRELLFGILHGMYCDPASSEETRLNALSITARFSNRLTPRVEAQLVDRHSEYLAKGQTDRQTASRQFFEKLGLLSLLSDTERHAIVSTACKNLLSVHHAYDNFYNEPPFAERLFEISSQGPIPESIQFEYVEAVLTCAVGNQYGVSIRAYPYYKRMIQNFSPREVTIMLQSPQQNSILAHRIEHYRKCRENYRQLVNLIDPASVPTSHEKSYKSWL